MPAPAGTIQKYPVAREFACQPCRANPRPELKGIPAPPASLRQAELIFVRVSAFLIASVRKRGINILNHAGAPAWIDDDTTRRYRRVVGEREYERYAISAIFSAGSRVSNTANRFAGVSGIGGADSQSWNAILCGKRRAAECHTPALRPVVCVRRRDGYVCVSFDCLTSCQNKT